jgi:Fe-S-cluster containining protein
MPPFDAVSSRSADIAEPACRSGCGACCIAPSITSPIPGMPDGKPAGVPCVQLDEEMRCRLFGRPERPSFCGGLRPSTEMCGQSASQAMHWLEQLEVATRPTGANRTFKRKRS